MSVTSPLRSLAWRQLLWAAGFSLAINLLLLTPSLFMLQVYDRVLVTRSVETLTMLLLLSAVALAAFGALDQVRSRLLTTVGASLERRFGPKVLEHLVLEQARQLPGSYADGLRDLGTLRGFLSGAGIVALFDAPWSLIYLGLIAAFDWRLGFLAFSAALLLLLLTWLNARQVRAAMVASQDMARASNRLAERCLVNAEVVTALGMSGALTRRWRAMTVALQDRTLAVGAQSGVLNGVSRALRQFVQVAMLSLGAWLVIHEGATPGVMIATTIILGRALAPIEQIIGGWQAMAEARLAYERLSAWLARTAAATPAMSLPRPQGHLSAENLGYAAGPDGRVLLRAVNLAAAPGALLAVVGGSGAGKTTLARLLVGVLRPTAGTVRVDGADIRQHDPRSLGAAMGYLPQDVELFAGTVAENIARFTEASGEAVIEAATLAGAHAMILRLPQGYDTPVGEGGRQLSGGQRQRVALARAVFGQPSIVVLDEPDASLDAEGEEALVTAIQALKARQVNVVAVTQRRRLLSIADQVLVLRDGVVERAVARNDNAGQAAALAGQAAGGAATAAVASGAGPGTGPATPLPAGEAGHAAAAGAPPAGAPGSEARP